MHNVLELNHILLFSFFKYLEKILLFVHCKFQVLKSFQFQNCNFRAIVQNIHEFYFLHILSLCLFLSNKQRLKIRRKKQTEYLQKSISFCCKKKYLNRLGKDFFWCQIKYKKCLEISETLNYGKHFLSSAVSRLSENFS